MEPRSPLTAEVYSNRNLNELRRPETTYAGCLGASAKETGHSPPNLCMAFPWQSPRWACLERGQGQTRLQTLMSTPQEGHALQDGSLPSRSTGIASRRKKNAFCRPGSTLHTLSRLSTLEQCLEEGRQPRLSAVIHNAVQHRTRSTSQL